MHRRKSSRLHPERAAGIAANVQFYTSAPLVFQRAACQSLPMLDEGVWAEIKIGSEHLRLFSERNAFGVQTSVYNVKTKSWIAPSEPVDDIEQGKEKAAAYAEAYLKRIANLELPKLVWKRSRSA
jgi:hypothetical protein